MELIEKYIYRIYEKKSVSAAAKSLFITQPALSTMLAKQEKKLGFKIFNRSTSPLSLTERGRIYIEHLHYVIESEEQMNQRLKLFSKENKMISVGGSYQLVYYLIPKVCKEFYRRHPDIAITIDLGNYHSNEIFYNKLKSHTLDFIFSYVPNYTEFDAVPVICEKFIIAMPKSIAVKNNIMDLAVSKKQILEKSYPKDKEISDFSAFKNIRFISYGSNHKQKLLKALLGENLKICHFHINNSKNLTMQYRLMREGISPVVAPDTHLVLPEFDSDDIVYFVPKSELSNRTLYFIVNQNRPENPYLDEFMAIAKEMMNNLSFY